MPEFAFTARDSAGHDVAGVMTAADKRGVLAALAERSLCAVRRAGENGRPAFRGGNAAAVKPRVLATNLAQLADLLQNGVPLLEALDLLAEQTTSAALREVLQDIRKNVGEGISLDQAFARHPQVFGELAVSMVHAGMEGAFLEDALRRTAGFLDLQEELKSRLVGAMIYPAFLAGVGTLVTVALVVFFVPKFSTLFERLERSGQGLPGSHRRAVGRQRRDAALRRVDRRRSGRRGLRSPPCAGHAVGKSAARSLEAQIAAVRQDFSGLRRFPLLPRVGHAAEERRALAEGPGNQQRIDGQPGAGQGDSANRPKTSPPAIRCRGRWPAAA